MHEVKVNKNDLLSKLIDNREQHIQDYNDAVKGYKHAASNALLERWDNIQKRDKVVDLTFNLPRPKLYKTEYDRVIEMVKMSVDNELVLSTQEFAQFVMDDWNWKQTFTTTNAFYAGS